MRNDKGEAHLSNVAKNFGGYDKLFVTAPPTLHSPHSAARHSGLFHDPHSLIINSGLVDREQLGGSFTFSTK
jgi:hypothetical protein